VSDASFCGDFKTPRDSFRLPHLKGLRPGLDPATRNLELHIFLKFKKPRGVQLRRGKPHPEKGVRGVRGARRVLVLILIPWERDDINRGEYPSNAIRNSIRGIHGGSLSLTRVEDQSLVIPIYDLPRRNWTKNIENLTGEHVIHPSVEITSRLPKNVVTRHWRLAIGNVPGVWRRKPKS
jgi:hypothetical protein